MNDEERKMKKFLKYYAVICLLAAGFILGWRFAPKPLPVLGKIPPFHFVSENGRSFDSQSLEGKVWIADFFYCTCHSSCPIQTAYMSELQKQWKNRPDFNLVSFTLDPKDDTLKVLAQYARDTGADPGRWFFLTGDKKDIYLLAQNGFKVTAQEDDTTSVPDFIHSTKLVLVDRQARIRGYYDVLDEDQMKELGSDLKRLL